MSSFHSSMGYDGNTSFSEQENFVQNSSLPVYNGNGQQYQSYGNGINGMLGNPSTFHQSPNVDVFEVRFKCTKGEFILPPSIHVKRGDFVKVEADRGYDIGIIFEKKRVSMGMNLPTKRIIGHINDAEMAILPHKINEETQAVEICRQMASHRGLMITIADVEFQFDRNKLTVIFSSEGRVDFRELVRDMFSFFRIRIWMQKVSPSEAVVLMELAAADGANNSNSSVSKRNNGHESSPHFNGGNNGRPPSHHMSPTHDMMMRQQGSAPAPGLNNKTHSASFERMESDNSRSSGVSSLSSMYSSSRSNSSSSSSSSSSDSPTPPKLSPNGRYASPPPGPIVNQRPPAHFF